MPAGRQATIGFAGGALVAFFALAMGLSPLPLSALGQKEAPEDSAKGLEDWEHDFDISKLPAGEYNFIVTGKDVAGNLSVGGPLNVYVDPASDLPIVSLINPTPLLRVGGDLNIVGTCVDDDGVARVEVSVDGGDFRPAQGGEFWSLYLGTKDLPDGRRTIAVRGVDINGVTGPAVKAVFNLDRSRPAASVAQPEPGALVAGPIKVEGSLYDANGIASLEVSTDGGKTFAKVDIKKDKAGDRASFSIAVDSRKFPDGPRILWLRSVDGVGSKGAAAFLLFIDNTKPGIDIALPRKDQAVNGLFTIAGAARDAIGIASLSYDFGGVEKGEIPLTPGNPYFSKEFDASAIKGDKAQLVLTAVDRIGNITKLEITPRIDREADKPKVIVAFPQAGGTLRKGDFAWGAIADDDGGAGIVYTVDGGPPLELAASDVFSIPSADLSSGRHLLSIRAKDIRGVMGDPLGLAVVVDAGPAVLSFLRLATQQKAQTPSPEAATAYRPGMAFRVDGGAFLEGSVDSKNLLVSASYSVALGAERKLELAKGSTATSYSFRIALDRTMPYGFTPIEVKVVDFLGGVSSGKALLWSSDLASAREEAGFLFDDPRIGEDGRLSLTADEPLVGAFYREDLASLRLEPPTDMVALSFEGRTVTVRAAKEGISPATRIVAVTKAGHEFKSQAFTFACDSEGPRITVSSPAEGSWYRGALTVQGRISDAGGLASATLLLQPGGTPRPLSPRSDGSFSLSLGTSDLPQGPLLLEFEALDLAGNTSRAFRTIGFDSEAPVVRFLSPGSGAAVSGPEDVAGIVSDSSGLALVEYSADGKTYLPVESRGNAFISRADLAANAKASWRLTDKAGNSAVARPEVVIAARTAAIPSSDALSVEPSGTEARVELSGTAASRPLSLVLPGLSEADFSSLGFADTKAEAGTGQAARARFGSHLLVSGSLSLKGKVSAAAAVKSLSWSLDGGESYSSVFLAKDAKSILPEAAVAITVDTAKLKDGEGRWVLRIEDGAGGLSFAPIYATIDNGKPDLSLVSPPASLTGPLPLVFRATDGGAIASAGIAVNGQKLKLATEEGGQWYAAWADAPVLPASGGTAPAAAKALSLAWEARDAAGNSMASSLAIPMDAQADTPRIELSMPGPAQPAGGTAAPAFLMPKDRIICSATDDDPSPSLRFILDGADAASFPIPAFGLSLAGLAPGKHVLTVEAVDVSGRTAGLKKDFIMMGASPRVASPIIGSASGGSAGGAVRPAPWFPGIEVEIVQGLGLGGTVSSPNGLVSLEYSVNGGPALKATLAKGAEAQAPAAFFCPLPASLPMDRGVIALKARDAAGLETTRHYDFHNVLKAAPGAPAADTGDAIRFYSDAVSDGTGGPRLRLLPGQGLEGWWSGRPLRSVAVEGPGGALDASYEGGRITILPVAETVPTGQAFRLRAETVDGDRFEWGPFGLSVDAAPPALVVEAPANDSYQKGFVRIAGRAEDPNGILSVEVSVNGSAYTAIAPVAASVPVPLPQAASAPAKGSGPAAPPAPPAPSAPPAKAGGVQPAATTKTPAPPAASQPAAAAPPQSAVQAAKPSGPAKAWPFDALVALGGAEDGPVRLDIVARDGAGKESRVTRYITKDTVAPVMSQVLPLAGESVNGTTTFIAEASDAGRIGSVVFLQAQGAKDAKGLAPPPPPPEAVSGGAVFAHTLDLAKTAFPLPEGAGFSASDKAGNSSLFQPSVSVDLEKDKPVVEIQAPTELEVIRADFMISGAVYDDDGIAALYWRIDGGEWTKVEARGASFSLPQTLAGSTDNEHVAESFAEDIYGVKSDVVSRRFRVSKEEPTALLSSPSLEAPVKGLIDLMGSAQDANGIESVGLSFDNGSTYEMSVAVASDEAKGTLAWKYPLDTAILKDGLHPITLRPTDRYGTEGFFATIITVDNTAPAVELSLPEDGALYSATMPLSGRVSDNIRLSQARVEIAPIGAGKPALLSMDLGLGPVIGRILDISSLPPGAYTVRLVGRDRASNESLVSRDIVVRQDRPADRVDLLFPVEGQEASGRLRLYGRALVSGGATSAAILVDGAEIGSAKLDALGFLAFDVPADKLAEGQRIVSIRAVGADGKAIVSRPAAITWKAEGPWVTIDSLAAGSYLSERPWLSGSAGWTAKLPESKDRDSAEAAKKAAALRRVTKVELSLDNGRSWEKAKGAESWKFRLETLDYPEGGLHVIVRATFADGSTSTAKSLFSLDKTPPEVRILEPAENGRFNGVIHVAGSASDGSGLASVGLALRKGDKRGYELPAFIQGLYIDTHLFGATFWDVGAGLSFFQDNVKLQVMLGQAPEEGRFGGQVYGAKLLANIVYLPASFILGPDWDFLSASFAVGANFSYFSKSASGSGLILGAVVAQVEFPKITIKDWSLMRKMSFYTEGQAWFVSSDVEGGVEFRLAFGVRLGLF